MTKAGKTIYSKVYVDADRIRTDMNAHGKTTTTIVLLYQKKMYTVLEQQKKVLVTPLSDAQVRQRQAATGGGYATFDLMGPETVNGINCLKYKMTERNDPTCLYWWIRTRTSTPVKMAAADGSFTVFLTNYQPGPQDASLFTTPTNYSVTAMQGGPLRAGVAPIGH